MNKANKNMTLLEYYHNLPIAVYPKTDLMREIATRCGVSINTARNWVFGNCRPANADHIAILSDITGIAEDKLFNN